MPKEISELVVESSAELRKWLKKNHSSRDSIWVITWKKDAGRPHVPYDEVVRQCLCFGWIDSLPRKLNDQQTMLRLSPRNPKSHWSALNKRRIAELESEGLMEPSGLAIVELAKKSGTWDFLDDVERLEIPEDLSAELDKQPPAKELFERFAPSSRRGILEWIKTAKTPQTRRRRIEETAVSAARNIKANHPKGRDAGTKAP